MTISNADLRPLIDGLGSHIPIGGSRDSDRAASVSNDV